jgi:hypothetical protein
MTVAGPGTSSATSSQARAACGRGGAGQAATALISSAIRRLCWKVLAHEARVGLAPVAVIGLFGGADLAGEEAAPPVILTPVKQM